MQIKNAIFDLDGTLIDSMHLWRNYQVDIIEELSGIKIEKSEREELVLSTYNVILKKVFDNHGVTVDSSVLSVMCEERMKLKYHSADIELKPYAKEYLSHLKKTGCGVALATATPKALCVPFLQKKGLYEYFDCIVTSPDDAHIGKHEGPAVYDMALNNLGGTKDNTAVFEDVLFAIKMCKKHNYYTIAVSDRLQRADITEIKSIADRYIQSYEEMMI